MKGNDMLNEVREELKKAYIRVPQHIYKRDGFLNYLRNQRLMKEISLGAGKKNKDLLEMQIEALDKAIKKLEKL